LKIAKELETSKKIIYICAWIKSLSAF